MTNEVKDKIIEEMADVLEKHKCTAEQAVEILATLLSYPIAISPFNLPHEIKQTVDEIKEIVDKALTSAVKERAEQDLLAGLTRGVSN